MINHTINKSKQKQIRELKKQFKNRSKWSVMNKYQKILMVCWKLTEEQIFKISKKQIAFICDCNENYIEHLFTNNKRVVKKTKKNLIFEKWKNKDKWDLSIINQNKFEIFDDNNIELDDNYEIINEKNNKQIPGKPMNMNFYKQVILKKVFDKKLIDDLNKNNLKFQQPETEKKS